MDGQKSGKYEQWDSTLSWGLLYFTQFSSKEEGSSKRRAEELSRLLS
jgi:hypothetical protein